VKAKKKEKAALTAKDNALLVARFYSAMNRHNAEQAASFFAERATLQDGAVMQTLRGQEAIQARLQEFVTAFPDLKFELKNIITTTDWVICEWNLTGTHKGAWMGVPGSSRRISVSGASLFHVINQRIFAKHMYWDQYRLLLQIGAVEFSQQGRLAA